MTKKFKYLITNFFVHSKQALSAYRCPSGPLYASAVLGQLQLFTECASPRCIEVVYAGNVGMALTHNLQDRLPASARVSLQIPPCDSPPLLDTTPRHFLTLASNALAIFSDRVLGLIILSSYRTTVGADFMRRGLNIVLTFYLW